MFEFRYMTTDGADESEIAQNCLSGILTDRFGKDAATDMLSRLRKDENGKPYIDGEENVFISLAHSGGLSAAAVSDKPVGIDTEVLLPLTEHEESVIRRFFEADAEALLADRTGKAFYGAWTRRESLFKAAGGKGLFAPPLPNPDGYEFTERVFDNAGKLHIITVCRKKSV